MRHRGRQRRYPGAMPEVSTFSTLRARWAPARRHRLRLHRLRLGLEGVAPHTHLGPGLPERAQRRPRGEGMRVHRRPGGDPRATGSGVHLRILGSMLGGFIAVPPVGTARRRAMNGQRRAGRHRPAVVLTTTSVAGSVSDYVAGAGSTPSSRSTDSISTPGNPTSAPTTCGDRVPAVHHPSTRLPAG